MTFHKIVFTQLYRIWSRPSVITLFVITPLLLVLVLGAGFHNCFSAQPANSTVRIAYLAGNSVIHNGFEVMLTQVPPEVLSVARVFFTDDGVNLLNRGMVDCFLEIPDESTILVYRNSNSALQASRLESILESFLDYFKLTSISGRSGFSLEYSPELRDSVEYEQIEKGRKIHSLDFFCYLILVMCLLPGSFVFSYELFILEKNGISRRIINSGQNRLLIWGAVSAANLLSILIQLLVLLTVSFLSLNVFFGPAFNGILNSLYVLSTLAFFMLGLTTLLATLTLDSNDYSRPKRKRQRISKKQKNIISMSACAALCVAMIIPLADIFQLVQKSELLPSNSPYSIISPLWWAFKALYESAFERGDYYRTTSILISLAGGVLFFTGSALFLILQKRRQSE